MYTISFRHILKTQVLYFSEGSSSESYSPHEISRPRTIDQLTEAQRSEVEQILQQFEQDPKI